jgi:hypothetical protein
MSLEKTRRNRLFGAAVFAFIGFMQLFVARHAQVAHTVILHKGSWYTPGVGYFAAACFLMLGACLFVASFRASDDKQSD